MPIIKVKIMATLTNRITIKRIAGELRDLNKNRISYLQSVQDDNDTFTFYFLLKGADDTDYRGGLYIGKILLDKTYPQKPGDFMFLTPNGRFDINRKICLTNSAYHSESWTPLWNIRNMLNGLYSIFIADDTTGISHIKESPHARRDKAAASHSFNIQNYPDIYKKFDQFLTPEFTLRTNEEIEAIVCPKKKPKEEPVPVPKEEPVPVPKKESVPVPKEEPVPVPKEESVPVLKEESVPVLKEESVPVPKEHVPVSSPPKPKPASSTTTAISFDSLISTIKKMTLAKYRREPYIQCI